MKRFHFAIFDLTILFCSIIFAINAQSPSYLTFKWDALRYGNDGQTFYELKYQRDTNINGITYNTFPSSFGYSSIIRTVGNKVFVFDPF